MPPITLEELQTAIMSFPAGKNHGPDGLPSKWYKSYIEGISPLRNLYPPIPRDSPPSMWFFSPNQTRPSLNCGFYQPISLHNMDLKILTKVLATRLSTIMEMLVDADQTGFIPHKSMDIHIHCLFTNLQALLSNSGMQVVVALNIENTFDSVDWTNMLAVLECMGFGPSFLHYCCFPGPSSGETDYAP